MSSSAKKRKTNKKEEHSPEPLPYDLLVSCFARASRLYYPTLSLVSKSFTTLIASPELYQTRSSLNHTESCLYVCLSFSPEYNRRWYTLCKKPNPNITNDISTRIKKKKPCGYVLAAIPAPPRYLPVESSGLVSIGSNIYNIGGPIDDNKEASSRVSILDCRSQTWQEGPRTLLERNWPTANVIDGKIYVAGGREDCNASNWMEVFDPKTQTWELVRYPGQKVCGSTINKSAGIDGKVYLFGTCDGLVYNTKNGKWERLGWEMDHGWLWFSYNMIGNVLYLYDGGFFKWYDTKVSKWKNLMGVKGFTKLPKYVARLADYGGKMAVFWHRKARGCEDKTIWCAVIELERRNNDEEIWGKVEWYDAVLAVPESCTIDYAISATV